MRTFISALVVAATMASWSPTAHAALTPGDVAIIGFADWTTNDRFAFVALAPIPATTVIYFTDNGWNTSTSNGFSLGSPPDGNGVETLIKFTANQNIDAGTIFATNDAVTPKGTWTVSGSVPGITGGSFTSLNLHPGGDQIYAFLGPTNNPLANPTQHLFVLDDTGSFANDGTGHSHGKIPPGLTLGSTALTFNLASRDAIAVAPTVLAGPAKSKSDWLTTFATFGSWETTDMPSMPTGTIVVNGGLTAASASLDNVLFKKGTALGAEVDVTNALPSTLGYTTSVTGDVQVIQNGTGMGANGGTTILGIGVDTATIGDRSGTVTLHDLYTDVDQIAITARVVEGQDVRFVNSNSKSLTLDLTFEPDEGDGRVTIETFIEALNAADGFTAASDFDFAGFVNTQGAAFGNLSHDLTGGLAPDEQRALRIDLDTTVPGSFEAVVTLAFSDPDYLIGGSAAFSDELTLTIHAQVLLLAPEPTTLALLALGVPMTLRRRR